MAKSFYFWSRKIAATSINFCLHIRGLDLSKTRESFFVAPHAFPTNAAEMIKDDISYLQFMADTIGCIAIGEVIPIYLWDPDTSNLINQKVPYDHAIIFSKIQSITYCATYLITGRYSGLKRFFCVELMRDCKDQKKGLGKSWLYIEFRINSEGIKRYFGHSRREQVKAKIFEEFVHYQGRWTNKILALLWVDTMKGVRKRYNNLCSVSCNSLLRSIFLFFSWLCTGDVKLIKVLTLFTDLIIESLPEKILFKRTERTKIKSEVFKLLEGIYYDGPRVREDTIGPIFTMVYLCQPALIYVVKKSS
jgi:hypothetical protein